MSKSIRINKYLSEAGVCSRREADRLIEEGCVIVNQKIPELGQKLLLGDELRIKRENAEELSIIVTEPEKEKIYLAFNKPEGIICTCQKDEELSIINYIKFPERIYPVGRLDQYSSGLILLTNDGDFANKLSHPRYGHEKEYEVITKKPIEDEFIKSLANGVELEEKKTSRCIVKKLAEDKFRIILKEGLNRQIRRMCDKLQNPVKKLKRVRVGKLELGDLKEGNYVKIDRDQVNA